LKVRYYSPFQDRVDVIDFGLMVSRGDVIDVSDEVGDVLLKHPHFSRVVDKPKTEAAPDPDPEPVTPQPAAENGPPSGPSPAP
jgi:hypothetical protein